MVRKYVLFSCVSLGLILPGAAFSQDPKPDQKDDQQNAAPARETVAKPLTDKQKRKQAEKLRKELETPYKKWLNEDVVYIITDEERAAFKRLQTDEEREQFIEQFWLRRDPTPDTVENEFKEEHYRRIAYANEHYASGIPGWKTDRGRIYIMYGPPDEIESHPSGRHLRAASGRGRRRNLHLSVRAVALPLHRRHRQQHHHRIRRPHHVGRVPHDHGPVRKGRPAVRARRRPHPDGADGHVRPRRSASRTPTAPTWARPSAGSRRA